MSGVQSGQRRSKALGGRACLTGALSTFIHCPPVLEPQPPALVLGASFSLQCIRNLEMDGGCCFWLPWCCQLLLAVNDNDAFARAVLQIDVAQLLLHFFSREPMTQLFYTSQELSI